MTGESEPVDPTAPPERDRALAKASRADEKRARERAREAKRLQKAARAKRTGSQQSAKDGLTLRPPDLAWEQLVAICDRDAAPVVQPLVLVSQIQRSGGTLLSQLFDHHPACYAHPHELWIGHPNKTRWPPIDPSAHPERTFELLFEPWIQAMYPDGYRKWSKRNEGEPDTFPLHLPVDLQREIFLRRRQSGGATIRAVLNDYMTSFFAAWLDYRGRAGTAKAVVTAFTAMLAVDRANREAFFDAYPDGHLVMIVRHPMSWYASARRHNPDRYGDLDTAMERWRESVRASVAATSERPAQATLVDFDRLLLDVETVMRRLCERIGIAFDSTLLEPTFNGWPIRADSSFAVDRWGVLAEPTRRHLTDLTEDERRRIQPLVDAIYAPAAAASI